MKTPSIQLFSFTISTILVSVSCVSTHSAFTHCLEDHNHPTIPISAVIYSHHNSSYSSVLQSYIRNLRFSDPTVTKPRFIVTPQHVSHIQAVIICAKAHGVRLHVRSGGHDFEGISYVSDFPDFVLLDMHNFRAVDVSMEDESAWVETGAILGELYYKIAEKSRVHGFPGGVCPMVGVGGHFSGGGYGNMMRKYGLTVDNIVDAKLIDVNGRLLDRRSMGEDVFWAITGGGGSSFGVVLSYKVKLVIVPAKVTVFSVYRLYDHKFSNLIYRYQEVAADVFPNELYLRLILDVAKNVNRARFVAMFLGNAQELVILMNESFPELGLTTPADCIELSWIESVLFWDDLPLKTPVKTLLDRVPRVVRHQKRKSDYLKKPIPTEGLELIFKKMVELETPLLTFNPYGGRMAEISASEKPFPHRAGNIFKLQYAASWDESGEKAAEHYLKLIRSLYECSTPFVSNNPRAAFLPYRDVDIGINSNGRYSYLEGSIYGAKYFKNNFDRLVKIKTEIDPDNFFRNVQSVPVMPSSSFAI